MSAKSSEERLFGGASEVSRSSERLYTPVAMTARRTYLISLAILVTAFVALYPYLGAMEMCDSGECPYAAQSSAQSPMGSAGIAGLCLGAVLAVSFAGVLAFGAFYGRRSISNDARSVGIFLSFDPPPPKLSLSR